MPLSPHARVRGCLLGGAIGDALGAGIEFMSLNEIYSRYGPLGVNGFVPAYGQPNAITDDTQMTLFTVEGLIDAHFRGRTKGIVHIPTMLWLAYQRWLVTQDVGILSSLDLLLPSAQEGLVTVPALQHRRAPGNTCLAGLGRSMAEPLPPSCAGSKGCGTVMRSAPFGLTGESPDWIVRNAVECSALTHGHPTAGHSSAALALIIDGLVSGRSIPDSVQSAIAYLMNSVEGSDETVHALSIAAAFSGPPRVEVIERLGGGWVAEEALAIAVYCCLSTASVEDAMLAAVNHSGDSDSTGSLCGNIFGAALGEEAFPSSWASEVEAADVVLNLADDFCREFRL